MSTFPANVHSKVTRHFYTIWFFQMIWAASFLLSHYDANRSGWHTEQGSCRFSGTSYLTGGPGHSLLTPPLIYHWKTFY